MHLHRAQLQLLISLLGCFNRKTSLHCLSHLYFTPMGDRIALTATDLELAFHWPLPGGSESQSLPLSKPASCPIAWFLQQAKAVKPQDHLELRLDDHGHLCAYPSRGPSARSPERSLPVKDAPAFTTSGFTRGGWIHHRTLDQALLSLPFASTDETRYVLNGVFISETGHTVATDGRRLAHGPSTIPEAHGATLLPTDFILPTRFVPALEALARGTVNRNGISFGPTHERMPVWFNAHGTRLLAEHSGLYLTVALHDGNYPNWRQVVPTDFNVLLTLSESFVEQFQTLCRGQWGNTTLIFTLHDGNAVEARLRTTDKHVPLHPEPLDAGTHVRQPGTEPFQVAYNALFLKHCLDFSGRVLHLRDEISPALGGDPTSRQTVLMPMRVGEAAHA